MIISDRIKFDELQEIQTTNQEQSPSRSLEAYSKSMSLATLGMDKLMGLSFGVVRFPIKIVLVIVALFLISFLWLVH